MFTLFTILAERTPFISITPLLSITNETCQITVKANEQKLTLIYGWNGKAKTYNNTAFDHNLEQENTVQIKSRIKKVKVTMFVEFFAI